MLKGFLLDDESTLNAHYCLITLFKKSVEDDTEHPLRMVFVVGGVFTTVVVS